MTSQSLFGLFKDKKRLEYNPCWIKHKRTLFSSASRLEVLPAVWTALNFQRDKYRLRIRNSLP